MSSDPSPPLEARVIGTAGHVDHGKTELVRALTGVDTDRWKQEKERGLSIDLGFAPLPIDPDLELAVVDVPGHEDFLKNMLAGATGIDLLLLVVAADEGPMPQTREHLTVARLLGVSGGVVALTKIDRVEEEWQLLAREAVEEEMRRVLGHARWPIVPVSSTGGRGLEELSAEIRSRARGLPGRPVRDLFRLPVDRAFTLRGVGTVVTGTLWSGSISVGETVRILPGERTARVRTLQVHGEDRKRVPAGRRCALALAGVDPEDTPRGAVLVTDDSWREVTALGMRLCVPAHVERPVTDGQRLRVYLGTREVMARIELKEVETVRGGEAWARLALEGPLVCRARDRLVLRFYSPVTTVGGGRVAELDPPAGEWRGRTGEWNRLLAGVPEEAAGAAVRLGGGTGLAVTDLPLVTGLPLPEVAALPPPPFGSVVEAEGRWFDRTGLVALRRELLDTLERLHRVGRRAPSASLEALRSAASGRYAGALIDRAVRDLEQTGEIVLEGPHVRLPTHRPSLTEEEARRKEALYRRIEEGGLEPPTLTALRSELQLSEGLLHDLLVLLAREERVVAISAELYVTRRISREMRERARRILREHPGSGPSRFKREFEVTRKYLIPMLEYLDRSGVSRRTGEGRVLSE